MTMKVAGLEDKMKRGRKMLSKVLHLSEKYNLKCEKPPRTKFSNTTTIAQQIDHLHVVGREIITFFHMMGMKITRKKRKPPNFHTSVEWLIIK